MSYYFLVYYHNKLAVTGIFPHVNAKKIDDRIYSFLEPEQKVDIQSKGYVQNINEQSDSQKNLMGLHKHQVDRFIKLSAFGL